MSRHSKLSHVTNYTFVTLLLVLGLCYHILALYLIGLCELKQNVYCIENVCHHLLFEV